MSFLQAFGRQTELLYFLTALCFHGGKPSCLLPRCQRDTKPKKKKVTKEDKLQPAHEKDTGLSQKSIQQRQGGSVQKKNSMYPLLILPQCQRRETALNHQVRHST